MGGQYLPSHTTRQKLLDVLGQFIKAGLENNESCLWVTSGWPDIQDAHQIISGLIHNSDGLLEKHLEIVPYTDIFFHEGKLDLAVSHRRIINRIRQATNSGYEGLRVAFDLSWAKNGDWVKMARLSIDAREIIENAIVNKTRSLVFVHNHPSGDPAPSRADKWLTRDLVFVGAILQIRILDHIIIGENRYFSFAHEGLIEEYETDFLNLKLTGTAEAKKRLSKIKIADSNNK
jgi:hypothetical protein